jgi:hypothetical protein
MDIGEPLREFEEEWDDVPLEAPVKERELEPEPA